MKCAARLTAGFVLVLISTCPVMAQERFSALAVNLTDGSFQSTLIDVSIERWSDEAEQTKYLGILATEGSLALHEAFRQAGRIGHLSMPEPNGLEIDVEYATQTLRTDGSRRILLVGYRNVSLGERGYNTSRSRFRFIAIELRLKPKGDGEGVLAKQADVSLDKNGELQFHDFVSPSILLKKVKAR